MFSNLSHAEAAFYGALAQLGTDSKFDKDMRDHLRRAFDYVLVECVRRGHARVLWHSEQSARKTGDIK